MSQIEITCVLKLLNQINLRKQMVLVNVQQIRLVEIKSVSWVNNCTYYSIWKLVYVISNNCRKSRLTNLLIFLWELIFGKVAFLGSFVEKINVLKVKPGPNQSKAVNHVSWNQNKKWDRQIFRSILKLYCSYISSLVNVVKIYGCNILDKDYKFENLKVVSHVVGFH